MAKKVKKVGENGDAGRDEFYSMALSLMPEAGDGFATQAEWLAVLAAEEGRHEVPAALAEMTRERSYGLPAPGIALLEAYASQSASAADEDDIAAEHLSKATETIEKFLNSKSASLSRDEGVRALVRIAVAQFASGGDGSDTLEKARAFSDEGYSSDTLYLELGRAFIELDRVDEAFETLGKNEDWYIMDRNRLPVDIMTRRAIRRSDLEVLERLGETFGSGFGQHVGTRQWGPIGYGQSPVDIAIHKEDTELLAVLLKLSPESTLAQEVERAAERCLAFGKDELARTVIDIWVERETESEATAAWLARLGESERAKGLLADADSEFDRGVTHFVLGEFDEAKEAFEANEGGKNYTLYEMARLGPLDPPETFVDGAIESRLEATDDAEESAKLLMARALLAARRGDEDAAADAFDAARKHAKRESGYTQRTILSELITDELRAGFPERALASALKVEKKHRKPALLQPIADYYLQAGDPAGALACIERIERQRLETLVDELATGFAPLDVE